MDFTPSPEQYIMVRKTREKRIQSGHPWLYASEIEKVVGDVAPGSVARVVNFKGSFLAYALYNPKSQITLRALTTREQPIDTEFFRKRIAEAWQYRVKYADPDSCRVVFAESDFLPALIVDKFADVLVMQTLCLGMDMLKDMLVKILVEEIHPRGIYERNDVPVRRLEGMEQQTGVLYGEVPDEIAMRENGLTFMVDVKDGQKTGFFLDQKQNRAAIAPFCKGVRALDCFCHNGAFALHMAKYGASDVLGIDISGEALDKARENAQLNHLDNVRFEEHNVFDFLREQYNQREKYDMIVLDPPAFTKSRSQVESAIRGYKEINLRAMKLLRDGGILVSCSCSQHVLPQQFMDLTKQAAYETRKRVRIIEQRTQGIDHPILIASDETRYLKCNIMQVFE